MHPFEFPHGNFHAREFHSGWVGIDGDAIVDHERELPAIGDSGDLSVANRTVSMLRFGSVDGMRDEAQLFFLVQCVASKGIAVGTQ